MPRGWRGHSQGTAVLGRVGRGQEMGLGRAGPGAQGVGAGGGGRDLPRVAEDPWREPGGAGRRPFQETGWFVAGGGWGGGQEHPQSPLAGRPSRPPTQGTMPWSPSPDTWGSEAPGFALSWRLSCLRAGPGGLGHSLRGRRPPASWGEPVGPAGDPLLFLSRPPPLCWRLLKIKVLGVRVRMLVRCGAGSMG